jgi:hypothetical protein
MYSVEPDDLPDLLPVALEVSVVERVLLKAPGRELEDETQRVVLPPGPRTDGLLEPVVDTAPQVPG